MRVIVPIPKQFEDSNGVPYANGKVTVYLHNSTSLAQIYKEAEGDALAPNPTILDSHGAWNAFVNGGTAYDYVVQDEHDNVIFSYSNVKAYGDAVTSDGIFPLEFNRNGIAAGSYDPLQGGSVDLNETETFNITQPNLYMDILQSIVNGRTPVIAAGSSGHVRLYYYTSKDTQNGTVTFTCGYDGIVELLVLHDDNTYEFVDISGNISVLKGNCDDNSIAPEPEGDAPEDWDCYEVEKEGEDIWIGDDNRVYAKAGWYHVDMGVHVTLDDQEKDVRAPILFGAYTGTAPGVSFDYNNYCAIDFDLSYDHSETHSAGFDIHVENDGDIIHLSTSAPTEYTAECYLDWFSIHRIKGAGAGGNGGGGGGSGGGDGDAAVFDLMDYAEDSQSDTLWRDMVDAMLDGKAVALKSPLEDDSAEAIGWLERSMRLKPGYTKEAYIEHILETWNETLQVFSFDMVLSLYGGSVKFIESIRVSPDGIRPDYILILVAGYGAIVEGGRFGSASDAVMPFNEIGDDIDLSRYGEVLAKLPLKGIPITFIGYNITEECMFNMATVDRIGWPAEPSDVNHTAAFTMEIHGIASWEGEDVHNGDRFPCVYSVGYGFLPPEEDAEIDVHGKWEIESDDVRPLAIDSTYLPNVR